MLDISAQAKEIGIDAYSLRKLYEVFVKSTQDDIKQLKAAIDEKDRHSIKLLAHHIKGAARGLEIHEISDNSELLELESDKISMESAKEKVVNMENRLFTLNEGITA